MYCIRSVLKKMTVCYDSLRFYMLFLSNVMFLANFTSPDMGRGMGKLSGDKPESDSVPLSLKIWIKLILPTISLYYTMCALVNPSGAPTALEWCSFFVLVAGFAFRMWCYIELGPFFTRTLGIRENHVLIKTGPYAYFVHPSYFGQILVVFNYLYLVDAHKLFIVVVALQYAKSVKFRMTLEEEMMLRRFGDEYKEHVATRWRLFPFV